MEGKTIVILLGLLVFSSCLASGLKITNTVGSNLGISVLEATYGAKMQDSIDHQIKLNPTDSTASNRYQGTGNLPFSSAYISDNSGDWAQAFREVDSKSGLGFWTYDWNTYRPSGGVGIWLTMDAHNANYIYGGSNTGNIYGDYAVTFASLSDSANTAALSGYWTQAEAYPSEVWSSNGASLASGKSVLFVGSSSDALGDASSGNQKAQGDSTTNGLIVTPFDYAFGSTTNGYSLSLIGQDASFGQEASMYTTSTNTALMKGHNSDYSSGGVESGITRHNNWLGGALCSIADQNNVNTGAAIDNLPWYKQALYLDPYKAEWAPTYGDTGGYVVNTLMNNEYLTTRYWDAAVTRSRVAQMANTPYSIINTHGYTDGSALEISRYYTEDGTKNLNNRVISASDLNSWYKAGNGANMMTILSACDSSNGNPSQLMKALADSGNSWTYGGYDSAVYINTNAKFLKYFFDQMANNNLDAASANIKASAYVGGAQALHLYGNTYLYD